MNHEVFRPHSANCMHSVYIVTSGFGQSWSHATTLATILSPITLLLNSILSTIAIGANILCFLAFHISLKNTQCRLLPRKKKCRTPSSGFVKRFSIHVHLVYMYIVQNCRSWWLMTITLLLGDKNNGWCEDCWASYSRMNGGLTTALWSASS